jgi:hypothetical protein
MYEKRIRKPNKIGKKEGEKARKSNKEDEFDSSTLYVCMGI